MAKVAEHIGTPSRIKQVLVIAEEPWLRFRLQRELERAGCRVASVARLRPAELAEPASYDVVLTDAALFPEGSRLEALRALRAGSPEARFVLLVGAEDREAAKQAEKSGFDLVLMRPTRAEALPELVREALGEARPAQEAVPVAMQFQFVLEPPKGTGKRDLGSAFTSFIVHSVILALALVVPLLFTESLDIRELAQTWLVAPPPPPPPPPAPTKPLVPRVRPKLQTLAGKLVAPRVIPREIARIVETDVELDVGGVLGGVPGGVPGGQMGGVIGGVLGGIPSPVAKPAPPVPQKPVRVGGNLRPPQLRRRVEPIYPSIAKQARIEGRVQIDAIIDVSGRVVEMKVLSGHPLLVQAAMEAVRRWVYEPTYLNEVPVPVVLEVTVTFRLR